MAFTPEFIERLKDIYGKTIQIHRFPDTPKELEAEKIHLKGFSFGTINTPLGPSTSLEIQRGDAFFSVPVGSILPEPEKEYGCLAANFLAVSFTDFSNPNESQFGFQWEFAGENDPKGLPIVWFDDDYECDSSLGVARVEDKLMFVVAIEQHLYAKSPLFNPTKDELDRWNSYYHEYNELTRINRLGEAEEELITAYPHVILGTLREIETDPLSKFFNKRTMLIQCQSCDDKRRVATSDLFQVKYCHSCTAVRKAVRKAEKKNATR